MGVRLVFTLLVLTVRNTPSLKSFFLSGKKGTATYQEDNYLNRCVNILQKIDIQIKMMERQNIITINGTKLLGPLSFVIELEE